jgi:hypothetical protein
LRQAEKIHRSRRDRKIGVASAARRPSDRADDTAAGRIATCLNHLIILSNREE